MCIVVVVVVSVIVKNPVFTPCAVDGRSRNPLYYYYYYCCCCCCCCCFVFVVVAVVVFYDCDFVRRPFMSSYIHFHFFSILWRVKYVRDCDECMNSIRIPLCHHPSARPPHPHPHLPLQVLHPLPFVVHSLIAGFMPHN